MTNDRPPETRATGWLKARRVPPPETPSGRSRRRLFGAARTVVIAAVAYSVFRFVLGLDVLGSFVFAAAGALTIAFAGRWFD